MKDSSHPSLQRFLNVLNPVRGFGASFKDRVWSGRRRGGSSPFRIVGWKKVALSWGCGRFISTICWEYVLFLQFSVFSSLFAGGLRG